MHFLTQEDLSVSREYNERHHGKGPMDGVGGTVKHKVFRAVMSNKYVINTPREFAECAKVEASGITTIFLPLDEIVDEPSFIEETQYVAAMESLKVHTINRIVTEVSFYLCIVFSLGEPHTDPMYIIENTQPNKYCTNIVVNPI